MSTLKLPILKTGDYDLWSMRMEQYLTHTDYALWEVIMNGDAPAIASASTEGPIPPKTAEQKLARKNELKAKSTLLLAIPDEHLLKFHGIKDAKTLWEAIKARFGGNKESKKMQKTILKQQYENFTASRSEGLDKTYDRFQKLISQLEIHGKVISQEDANLKLLRSLPSAWNNIALIMHNKADLDELSMDDLYNNLKVTNEAVNTAHDVPAARSKGQASSSTYADDVMFSFFVNQSISLQLDNEDLEQINIGDLKEMDLKWQVAMLTMRVKRFLKKKEDSNFKMAKKLLALIRQRLNVTTATGEVTLLENAGHQGIKGIEIEMLQKGFYQAEEGPTDFALMAHLSSGSSSSSSSNTEVQNCSKECLESYQSLQKQYDQQRDALKKSNLEIIAYQLGLESLEARIVIHQKNEAVYEKDIAFLKYVVSQMNENELHDCHLNKSGAFESAYDSSVNEIKEESNQVNDRFKKVEGYHVVPPPYTGNYMPLRPDLSFAGLDDSVYKTNVSGTISSVPRIELNASKSSKHSLEQPKDFRPSAPIIEEWESDSDDDCVIRPSFEQNKPSYAKINFVKSDENTRKSVIEQHTYRQAENLRKSQSPRVDKRNWNGIMTQKLGDGFEFNKKACFVCGSLNHLIKDCNFYENKMVRKSVLNNMGRVTGQREVRPVWNNAQRVNHQNKLEHPLLKRNLFQQQLQTKCGLVPVNAAKQASRVAASICTARACYTNALYQSEGKIRTGKLDFEDVYFVKELKFNLFSVSQMCDKKNSVLFTKTECLVLSPDFKLLDESQVLLKVLRQNNMYSFDLKNVVPSGGLTCLIAKATIDESNLWHRRLGHINFKTINKLVRENLVIGLPLKLFENDHTCVACQKGKQHKASCKTKLVSSISHPLQMLHMDLFGPTFVRSINHKIYCLVVTDDYSRFSWVFFLATKDETSGILKTFITGIENQINHKVKIIRCDNGTEFKNNDMNQFCGMKGIKREFSVARTPQQNGVAERKNRTLIEAARTMLADSLLPTTFWAEAVNTACYVQNRVLVTKPHNKTPYELLLGRPPSISFMRPFGCPVTILNTLDPLGKFDGKADEGFLVGYSINSKAFRVFNSRTRKVEENLHINFLENKPNVAGSGPEWLFDIDSLTKSMNYEPVTAGNQTNGDAGIETNVNAGQAGQEKASDHEYILLPLMLSNSPLSSSTQSIDDKDADEVPDKGDDDVSQRNGQEKEGGASNKEDDQHVQDFRAELDSFLVQQKEGYANSTNRDSTASPSVSTDGPKNTGIFDDAYNDREVGAEADLNNLEPTMNVSPIPTTRIHKDHPKDQIIGDINLATQTRRMTKISEEHAMVIQALTDPSWIEAMQEELLQFKLQKFEQMMHKRFQMSSIGELTFFLELKVQQKEDGIFISQDKYVADILKKFDFVTVKTTSTPMEPNKALVKDEEADNVDVHLYRLLIRSLMYLTASRPDIPFDVCACGRDSPFDLEAFFESDYVGASLDRKSTTRGCQFLGKRLISWQCKKQTIVANSTTKAEYVATANCCGQTATVRTVDNGEQEINATVDGTKFTITEASVRRHLQLAMQMVFSILSANTESLYHSPDGYVFN
ncbi:putative ribonuclease H-like domain-containing protein [Tanacetum coccineum]